MKPPEIEKEEHFRRDSVPGIDPESLEEGELVALCHRVPPIQSVWNELYRRYYPTIRSRIQRGSRVFPDSLVEDIVQEVFLKLARGALRSFKGRCSLHRYLIAIADSARISENRRWMTKKRKIWRVCVEGEAAMNTVSGGSVPSVALMFEPAPSHLLSPEDNLLRAEKRKCFRLLLRRLPDRLDRTILFLYFGEDGKNDREIGKVLNLPTNTVTWRRHRALKMLREMVGKGVNSLEMS